MTETVTGGYVRHRDRMVQESVFQDVTDTLIACRWMPGTTSRAVISPYDASAGWQVVTTTSGQVLKLLEGSPINLIDYFPDAEADDADKGVAKNTFAVDNGRIPDEPTQLELGSDAVEVIYVFNMAFYAISDAVAQAVFNDLRDRYRGIIVGADWVNLYNFNVSGFGPSTPPVSRMEALSFKYARDVEQVAPWEANLYFGELQLIDTQEPM